MKKEILEKANELFNDINAISKVVKEKEQERHWIRVITPNHTDEYYSGRFQEDLIEWLKSKKEEYQKEFDKLS